MRARVRGRHLVILGWHNVEGTYCFPSAPGTGTDGLTQQFRFLARFANVVSLPDALDALARGQALPPRAVALTFDDGYLDNLEIAAPILQSLGLPATFFLVPELLDGGLIPWWEQLGWAFHHATRSELQWDNLTLALGEHTRDASYRVVSSRLKLLNESARRAAVRDLIVTLEPEDPVGYSTPIMGWDQARSLRRQGFTIGSHTMHHAILANESRAAQADDLRESRDVLRSRLGAGIDLLAYPNGTVADFNQPTLEGAQAAGYRGAVTTIDGWNDSDTPSWELRRFIMYPEWGIKGFGIVPRHPARILRQRLRTSSGH